MLLLFRRSDSKYWTGITWGRATPLSTVVTGNSWVRNGGLPSGESLADGAYLIGAYASSSAGNRGTDSADVIVDATAPTNLAFVSPADAAGDYVHSLQPITGTVADNTSGSGIGQVNLFIQRNSDGQYWTGSAWSVGATALVARVSGNNWSCSSGPQGADLIDGAYTLSAEAFDQANNRIAASITVTVDTVAPTVSIKFLVNDDRVNTFYSFTGTAQDNVGGSGVDRVVVNVVTHVINATSASSLADVAGTTWTYTGGPDKENLVEDGLNSYVYATVYDRAGNFAQSVIRVRVDKRTPVLVGFRLPFNQGMLTSLSPIYGSAYDNTGSGLSRVALVIYRLSDGKYWTGTTWGRATALSTTLSGNFWTRDSGLPSGANLTPGKYRVSAYAYSVSGARAGQSGDVMVSGG